MAKSASTKRDPAYHAGREQPRMRELHIKPQRTENQENEESVGLDNARKKLSRGRSSRRKRSQDAGAKAFPSRRRIG